MRFLAILALAGALTSIGASAETPEEVLNLLQRTFDSGDVNSFSLNCKDGWVSTGGFSFSYNTSKNELLVSIMNKYFRGFMYNGLYFFVANPGYSVFDRYAMVDTKIDENSDAHLKMTSHFMTGQSSVDTQHFDYNKLERTVTLSLDSNYSKEICHLK